MPQPPYHTGTVAVVNGDATVTGTGTAWSLALVTGGMFSCNGLAIPIASVTDDTHLELDYNWPGSGASGQTYSISRNDSAAASVINLNDRLLDVADRLAESGALGDDPGALYRWDTGTSDADPGAGLIRANNASLASATFLYASKTSRAGSSLANFLATLDDSSNTIKGSLALLHPVTQKQAFFLVSTLTDATNYVKIGVTTHSGETAFGDEEVISLQFSRAGNKGSDAAADRELLTANRTYYVRADGSNSNTGLVDSAGGAFLTIQKAIETVYKLDLAGFDITIQVRSGTFTTPVVVAAPWVGKGTVSLLGDTTTPTNCVISTTSASALLLSGGAKLTLGGFKIQTTTSGTGIGVSGSGSLLDINFAMNYGACAGPHLDASSHGRINVLSGANYTISGGASSHYSAFGGGFLVAFASTITLTGTPAFSTAFCNADYLGLGFLLANAYSGSATGKRYIVNNNSVVNAGGAGANYFPGNVAGTTATGGQYV